MIWHPFSDVSLTVAATSQVCAQRFPNVLTNVCVCHSRINALLAASANEQSHRTVTNDATTVVSQPEENTMTNQRFMTLPQVCAEIGVSRSTMDKWRLDGRAPAFRKLPNGSLRVSVDLFESWLEQLPAADAGSAA